MQILEYYPPVIKQIKEIQQIAKAEDKEFLKLASASESVLGNMFISTSDEEGIARFEKILGIVPDSSRTLEERKMYVLSVMNKCKLTLLELVFMLSAYADDINVVCDYKNYELYVNSGEYVTGISTIYNILDEFLPLQVYIIFAFIFTTITEFKDTVTNLILETNITWWNAIWCLDGIVKLDGNRKLNAVVWEQTVKLILSTIQKTSENFDIEEIIYALSLTTEMEESQKTIEFESFIDWWNVAWCLDGTVKLDSSRKLDAVRWEQTATAVFETSFKTEEHFTDVLLEAERNFWCLDGTVKLDGSRKLNAKKITEVL